MSHNYDNGFARAQRDYERREPDDVPDICPICLLDPDDCICPACFKCAETGNPKCYKSEAEGGHGMEYTDQQLKVVARNQQEYEAELAYEKQQAQEWEEYCKDMELNQPGVHT